MDHADILLSRILSPTGRPSGFDTPVGEDLLLRTHACLQALRHDLIGPSLSPQHKKRIRALGITGAPALDDAYQRLLRNRPDLARRSLPEEVFIWLIENQVVLSSLGSTLLGLSLGLLQVVSDVGQELKQGNARLLALLASPSHEASRLPPQFSPDWLRIVFAAVLQEKDRIGRRAHRPGRDRTGPHPSPLFSQGKVAALPPLLRLKQVSKELLDLAERLGVEARTVTANSDAWAAYSTDQRSLCVLTRTAFEANPDLDVLASALRLSPAHLQDALNRQTESLSGHLIAQELCDGVRTWQQVFSAALYLARCQVRTDAMKMLADGLLDVDELSEVRDLSAWTLLSQRKHQEKLRKIQRQGSARLAELTDRRKLMQVLAALRDHREPDMDQLIEAADLYQRFLAEAEGTEGYRAP